MKIQVQPLENASPHCILMLVPQADGSAERAVAAFLRKAARGAFLSGTEFAVSTTATPTRWSEQPLSNMQKQQTEEKATKYEDNDNSSSGRVALGRFNVDGHAQPYGVPLPAGKAPERKARRAPRGALSPIFQALDTNHDGVIDANEVANASAALKTLLRDGSVLLTPGTCSARSRRAWAYAADAAGSAALAHSEALAGVVAADAALAALVVTAAQADSVDQGQFNGQDQLSAPGPER